MRAGGSRPRLSSLTTAEEPGARVVTEIVPHVAVTRLPPESSMEPSQGDAGEESLDRMVPASEAIELLSTARVEMLLAAESSNVLAVTNSEDPLYA